MGSTRKSPSGNRADTASATSRWYVFCVVALAVFVTCLLLCRQPIDGYVARTVLLQRGPVTLPGGHAASAAAHRDSRLQVVTATLASRELLRRVVRQTGLVHSDASGAGVSEEVAAQWIQARLRINVVQHDTTSGELLITIEHAGKVEQDALAVVEALSSEYVQSQLKNLAAARCQKCEEAKSATVQATVAWQAARAELETFRATHARQLNELGLAVAHDAAPADRSEIAPPESAAQPHGEVRQRLEVLRAAYQELAPGDAEPTQAARDLAWQIHQLEQQLRPGESGNPPEATRASRPTGALGAKYRLLKAVANAAQRRWEETVAAEKQANKHYRDQSELNVEVVHAAHVAHRFGGGVSHGALLLAGLLALAAAALATWRAQGQAAQEVLVNLEQVERLGVPVLAVLATGDGPRIAAPEIHIRPAIAWITFGCELLLATILIVLLVLSLLHTNMAWTIIHDPLQGLLDGVGLLAAN